MEPTVTGDSSFSRKEAIGFGWTTVKSHFGLCLLLLIILGGINFIPYFMKFVLPVQNYYLRLLTVTGASLLFGMLANMGAIAVTLKLTDNKNTGITDIFPRPGLFFKYLVMSFVSSLFTLGGFLLLIVPGIIWSVEFSLAPYFVMDQGVGPIEALKRSLAATRGVKNKLLVFQFLLGGVVVLGALALGVGLLAAIPTVMIAEAFVYRKLQIQAEAKNSNYYPPENIFFSGAKIAGLVTGVILTLVVAINTIAPQIVLAYMLHRLIPKTDYPMTYTLPEKRTVMPPQIQTGDYPVFAKSGISFRAPWKKIVNEKTLVTAYAVDFEQKQRIILMFADFKMAEALVKDRTPAEVAQIKSVFGEKTLDSDYNLFTATINTSPDQLTYKTSPPTALSLFILTVMKKSQIEAMASKTTGMYSFEINGIRGYQFGVPETDHLVLIHFFDDQDRTYDLRITGNPLTQNDIDFILGSIGKSQP